MNMSLRHLQQIEALVRRAILPRQHRNSIFLSQLRAVPLVCLKQRLAIQLFDWSKGDCVNGFREPYPAQRKPVLQDMQMMEQDLKLCKGWNQVNW